MQTGSGRSVYISIREQRLIVKEAENAIRSFPISTSRFGLGSEEGSWKTPLGEFRIGQKIGQKHAQGTIFKGRKPIDKTAQSAPDDDLVMSRILWLHGVEEHNANTRERYIYIHGTNHEEEIGQPASRGCIRMTNADVIELFDLVDEQTPVLIEA
jgi:lipoprotein-anchoring transpeptidase ErfK/SrfK